MSAYLLGFLGGVASMGGVAMVAGEKAHFNIHPHQLLGGIVLIAVPMMGTGYQPYRQYAIGLLIPALLFGIAAFVITCKKYQYGSIVVSLLTAIASAITIALISAGPGLLAIALKQLINYLAE